MLTQIEIRSYRSCRQVVLDNVKEILALIGRNGAGKTNILKAIDWACRFSCTGSEKQAGLRRQSTEDGDVGLTFTLEEKTYRYEVSKVTTHNDDFTSQKIEVQEKVYLCDEGKASLLVHRIGEQITLFNPQPVTNVTINVSGTIPALIAISSFLPEDNDFRIISEKLMGFMSSVKYYPLHNFDENIEEVYVMGGAYQKWKSEKNKDSNSLSSVMFKIITLFLERRNTFDELVSLIGADGLGLVYDIQVEEHIFKEPHVLDSDKDKNRLFLVNFRQASSTPPRKLTFNINDLSFGTKRILFLLVSMLYDKASVSLLEQPEDGVHIGLVDKLLPLFRSYSQTSQFIIATHSTTILNKTTPDEIFFISNYFGNTLARKLSPSELEAAEVFLRDEGPLSEFLEMIGSD